MALQTFFENTIPTNTGTDNTFYTMGLVFKVASPGKLVGARFYKPANEPNITHTAKLWNFSTSALIASVDFTDTSSGAGWKEQTFTTPIDVVAGTTYLVSVNSGNASNNGYYAYEAAKFVSEQINGDIIIPVNGGKFGTDLSAMPTSSFNNSHYYRDLIFQKGGTDQRLASSLIAIATTKGKLRSSKRLFTATAQPVLTKLLFRKIVKLQNANKQTANVNLRVRIVNRLRGAITVSVILRGTLRNAKTFSSRLQQTVVPKATLKTANRLVSRLIVSSITQITIRQSKGKLSSRMVAIASTKVVFRVGHRLNSRIVSRAILTVMLRSKGVISKPACLHVKLGSKLKLVAKISKGC